MNIKNNDLNKNMTLEHVLRELILMNDELLIQIEEKERLLLRQKIQMEYLGAQNMRYKRIMDRISSRWYGRILKKCYHLSCRLGIIKPL